MNQDAIRVDCAAGKEDEGIREEKVLIEEEDKLIKDQRADQRRPHLGLAFSGGGIRSATFNLGILQGLAKLGLLKQVDYLSTVSGGGYIGSWLTAWIHRKAQSTGTEQALKEVEDNLARSAKPAQKREPQLTAQEQALKDVEDMLKDFPEPIQIRFLRDHSNYLTPKAGLLSSDTLAAASNLVRNLLLNQAALIFFLIVLLLVPWLMYFLSEKSFGFVSYSAWLVGGAGIALLGACIWRIYDELKLNPDKASTASRQSDPARKPSADGKQTGGQERVLLRILAPAYLASALLAMALGRIPADWLNNGWYGLIAMLAGAVIVVSASWGRIVPTEGVWGTLAPALTGALGGWLLFGIAKLAVPLGQYGEGVRSITTLGMGTVLVMVAFSLMATLLIGLIGRGFSEVNREWWGRLGGWALMLGLVWGSWFAVVILGSVALVRAGIELGSGGGLAWLATTAWGVWMGRSEQTGGDKPGKSWTEAALGILPYVFILGLLILLAWLIQGLTAGLPEGADFMGILTNQMERVARPDVAVEMLVMLVVCGTGFWVLNQRLDVNLFSMHHFYHNRLARCYLGASNPQRNSSDFTGFDDNDEKVYLHTCQQRPFHIVNAAMNLTAGKKLGWQQRKAASFVLTPLHVGYKFPGANAAYRSIEHYMKGTTKLSTAVTISGAAASPNMGYHSSPAMAFLLTLFNVRLGRWCANPGANNANWKELSPKNGGKYLINELFGLTDADSEFVYLSDGGHFENLGIYELVRRKCGYIIASDAGQDAAVAFEDLGNAVRKCHDDFGVRIDIDTHALRPNQDSRFSHQHCVMGEVYYPGDKEGKPSGRLFYIKASLTGDEPIDVLQYSAANTAFPHQSTADQWFDEAQFESYRNLGQHIAEKVFTKAAAAAVSGSNFDLISFFGRLGDQWYAPSLAEPGVFSRHGNALMKLFETLRAQPLLNCLDGRFYPPSVNQEPPTDTGELRQIHYVGNRMIQLMEDVYLDLNLEEEVEYEHPDHQGWVELFKCWSQSTAFRRVWVASKNTYGQRFRMFCNERLGLP